MPCEAMAHSTKFIHHLRIFSPKSIAGQSMRAGGATVLAEDSTAPVLTQAAGRWSLDTFNHYVRQNPFLFEALLTGCAPRVLTFTSWFSWWFLCADSFCLLYLSYLACSYNPIDCVSFPLCSLLHFKTLSPFPPLPIISSLLAILALNILQSSPELMAGGAAFLTNLGPDVSEGKLYGYRLDTIILNMWQICDNVIFRSFPACLPCQVYWWVSNMVIYLRKGQIYLKMITLQ